MADRFADDPFAAPRAGHGVLSCTFVDETMPMLLRYRDVRAAARDVMRFSSDARGRVTIPAEDKIRDFRQLPIESDPPLTRALRDIVMPIFRRPSEPGFGDRIADLVDTLLDQALAADQIETVAEFALPLQSRALAKLFNMPASEAEVWISWGTHAYRVAGRNDSGRAAQFIAYLDRQLDAAEVAPSESIFGMLVRAELEGVRLSRSQQIGFAHLAFSGGRDTVINSITGTLRYLASHPADLARLKADPKLIPLASEELFRVLSPISFIGRVCPVDELVQGEPVPAGQRVALGWASANFDEAMFEAPGEVRLDRQPNPHMAFGAGVHTCLGALHARLVIRTLLARLCGRVSGLTLIEDVPTRIAYPEFERRVGSERLRIGFS